MPRPARRHWSSRRTPPTRCRTRSKPRSRRPRAGSARTYRCTPPRSTPTRPSPTGCSAQAWPAGTRVLARAGQTPARRVHSAGSANWVISARTAGRWAGCSAGRCPVPTRRRRCDSCWNTSTTRGSTVSSSTRRRRVTPSDCSNSPNCSTRWSAGSSRCATGSRG